MAIFYVSNQNGKDTNTGQANDKAKKTIGAGLSLLTASAGDILYIGPGTYRETATIVINGAYANRTKIIGDPNCLVLTADKPGYVRMTGTTTANIQSYSNSGRMIDCSTKGANYEFRNILFDGNCEGHLRSVTASSLNSTYGIYGSRTAGLCYAYNCCMQNLLYGAKEVYVNDCFICVSYQGLLDCICENSVIMAGSYAMYGTAVANVTSKSSIGINSILIGGGAANTRYTHVYNCLGIASQLGYYQSVINNSGVLANGYCSYDVGAISSTPYSAAAINNFFASNTQNVLRNVYSSSATMSGYYDSIVTMFSVATERASLTALALTSVLSAGLYRFDGWRAKEYIKKAFEPIPEQCGLSGIGAATYASSAGLYDILGKNRQLGLGTSYIDIGPYALNNIEEKYTTGYYHNNAPGFYFTNIGQKIIDIYSGTGNLTVSA